MREAQRAKQDGLTVLVEHEVDAVDEQHAGLVLLDLGDDPADGGGGRGVLGEDELGVLAVVEPMKDGLGGDLFVMYWEANTGKLVGLNGSGAAPKANLSLENISGLDCQTRLKAVRAVLSEKMPKGGQRLSPEDAGRILEELTQVSDP